MLKKITFLLLFSFILGGTNAFSKDLLTVYDDGTAAGYVTISWEDTPQKSFVLEVKKGDDWHKIYSGQDKRATFSGLMDGIYIYRLMSSGTELDQLEVHIDHYSLQNAFLFFGLGALVFLSLLYVLFEKKD